LGFAPAIGVEPLLGIGVAPGIGVQPITEGFHNKMELISRQAYGFRNFENYRMRVKVLCS
jgi:hypothetical protein